MPPGTDAWPSGTPDTAGFATAPKSLCLSGSSRNTPARRPSPSRTAGLPACKLAPRLKPSAISGTNNALEDQLDFGGLLDRKVGQLLPLENPARPCDRPNDGLGVRGFHARSGAEATPRRTHRGVSAARPRLETLCIAVCRPPFSSNRNWNT